MIKDYTEILIVITAGPSVLTNWQGVSAGAWEVSLPGADEHGLGSGFHGVEVSDHAQSNESEAALLALNAALSLAQDNNRVVVLVSQTWICDGINGGADRWKADGWKGRSQKVLWEEYQTIRERKRLRVEGEHVAAADKRVASRFRFHRKQAKIARDRRSKELGTPTQGFDPI